jgi:hypothetical protein
LDNPDCRGSADASWKSEADRIPESRIDCDQLNRIETEACSEDIFASWGEYNPISSGDL